MPSKEPKETILNLDELRRLRIKLDLTLDAAANIAGMSGRSEWSDIESGRRANIKLETLDRIAKALGVKAKDLLK